MFVEARDPVRFQSSEETSNSTILSIQPHTLGELSGRAHPAGLPGPDSRAGGMAGSTITGRARARWMAARLISSR